MNYKTATELTAKNSHLIGRAYKGGRIDELIMVPKDQEFQAMFLRSYLSSLDFHSSIAPFVESELDIWIVVNKPRIHYDGLLCENLFNLGDEYNVISNIK